MSGSGAGDDVTNFEPSGVWYCRNHHGIMNEDEGHDELDVCSYSETEWDDDGVPLNLCDWTELVYSKAVAEPTPPAESKVVDLLAALENSVAEARKAREAQRG